ncbi:MAG: 5-formyltetrahydrofolate cyclo-ligase [Bacillota bacterium]|uniref:5-formyltetrahydrofolate cyclo-ligase n=1 Tax=Thermanaerosceptrum fracticalcis TaxID=1712410 RepID=UPI0005571315|nr:5-formyltetrahydrofolate cyclo-ligase [Thermanaerosceptrum fracticalcis]
MDKKTLRKTLLKRRESLSWLEVQGKSHEITQRVLFLPEYKKAETILIYLAYNKELDTSAIMQTAWQQKKKIVVPVCQPRDRSLLLSELLDFNELAPGTWGILEPKAEFLRPVPVQNIDLLIIPCVAFDREGYRLGYGGGYFDRFLPAIRSDCTKVGLAYDFQLLDELPREPHDTAVDIIITESRTYYVKKESP